MISRCVRTLVSLVARGTREECSSFICNRCHNVSSERCVQTYAFPKYFLHSVRGPLLHIMQLLSMKGVRTATSSKKKKKKIPRTFLPLILRRHLCFLKLVSPKNSKPTGSQSGDDCIIDVYLYETRLLGKVIYKLIDSKNHRFV